MGIGTWIIFRICLEYSNRKFFLLQEFGFMRVLAFQIAIFNSKPVLIICITCCSETVQLMYLRFYC
jgi:hypothetical protein